MKFKKDGKIFDNIELARITFCHTCGVACKDCKVSSYNNRLGTNCSLYCQDNQIECAKIMGFEIVEDEKEDKMQNTQIDIGKMTLEYAKEYCKDYAEKRQHMRCYEFYECELKKAGVCKYNQRKPSEWSIEQHALSEPEIDICKVLGVKWITVRDMTSLGGLYADLWDTKPTDGMMKRGESWQHRIGEVLADKFPSLKPGDCVCVEDAMSKNQNCY